MPRICAGPGVTTSDLTDARWQVIVSQLPAEWPGGGEGPVLAVAADHRGQHVPGPARSALSA